MNTTSGSFHRRAPRVSYLGTIKVTIKPSKSKSHLEIQTARSSRIIDDWRTYLSRECVETIPTPRDIESLAHRTDRPNPSMPRHERESQPDSFAN
jgi:hypothetical protein